MSSLIIVESPTKARTLSRFLGSEYRIEATLGHIRDLPKKELGIDIQTTNNKPFDSTRGKQQITKKEGEKSTYSFIPEYKIIEGKNKRVSELRNIASQADKVILATDPDREGEAIAFHTKELLTKKKGAKRGVAEDHFNRIVFHEITKEAILGALDHPGKINMQLVASQQARRVLDRLVGYTLSPLLWNKLRKRWLSAGRVQSVAVRLIVEREREREKFVKEEFWRIFGTFSKNTENIEAELVAKDKKPYEQTKSFNLFDGAYTTTKTTIAKESDADAIILDLASPYTVSSVVRKEVRRSPLPPYTTSKLQQDSGRIFYFSSKKTMQLAQKLYEEGLITYHRTDSYNLSEKFLTQAKEYILTTLGETYYTGAPRTYTAKSKVAQEAHEAIRPTNISDLPALREKGHTQLFKEHIKLYELIWKRAVASQVADARFDATVITITSSNAYSFETKGSIVTFDGYLKIAGRSGDDVFLPKVTSGDVLTLMRSEKRQKFTSPPPRYSEASLIKVLEEKDIGRPSTYAPTISTILDRLYVEKVTDEGGNRTNRFAPTDLGYMVNDFLVEYFPSIVELPFTAKMEENLDEIANGAKEWQPVISEFYGPFKERIDTVYKTVDKVEVEKEEVGEKCPKCGSPLLYRTGRFGKFIACSRFPECKYTRSIVMTIEEKCPRCGLDMVVKRTRRGKQFYGCSQYPKCTFAAWKKEDIK